MSVIGSLDDQVDAVLIKPLTKEHATDPELASEVSEDVKLQVTGDTAPAKDKSFNETSVLPVWLL